jgi:hypothetical protein
VCDARPVSGFDPSRSRRYAVPPLWAVPLLLIGGFIAAVYVSTAVAGFFGLVAALVFLAWVEPKVDDYVRARTAERD